MSLTGAEVQPPSSAIFDRKEDNSFEQVALRIPIVRVLLRLDKNVLAPFCEGEEPITHESAMAIFSAIVSSAREWELLFG